MGVRKDEIVRFKKWVAFVEQVDLIAEIREFPLLSPLPRGNGEQAKPGLHIFHRGVFGPAYCTVGIWKFAGNSSRSAPCLVTGALLS